MNGLAPTSSGRQLAGALWQGVRSALLLRPHGYKLDIGLAATILLALIYLLGVAAFEFTMSPTSGAFDGLGLGRTIATLALTLGLLAAVPFASMGAATLRLFTGFLSLSTIIYAVMVPVRLAVRSFHAEFELMSFMSGALTAVTIAWLASGLFRLAFGEAKRARFAAGLALPLAVLVASVTLPVAFIFPDEDMPELEFSIVQAVANARKAAPADKAVTPPRPRIDFEAVMVRQPELLAAALKLLQPPRGEQPELYYVSMAPFAGQDVFKRESGSVKALFDDKFDTAGRSIALVNHRDTVETTPLASVSNLDRTLAHVGRLMRPDKDVLFLFLTSHGTEGMVSVQFPRFPLNDITPANLRAALDKSGIRNRVLVISACHSGSFIPGLKDDNTLILTAARADRTSFGCSNENEWTYFGDAYFNNALRSGERSFIAAFDQARTLITGWEQKQKYTPSEPQISIGANIAATLASLQRAATPAP
jgi:hypothetical protein